MARNPESPPAVATRPRAARAFLILFAAALLVRLWPLLAIRCSWEDAYYYLELARSLAGGRYELLGEFHLKYLPGYPALILLVHSLTLGQVSWFTSAQLASALAGAALPGLCWIGAHDLTEERGAAWAAGLMALFNAWLVTWSGVPFSEGVFAAQVMVVLVLTRRAPLGAGLLAGLAALTRHEGWLLAVPLALPLLEERGRWRRVLGGLVLMTVLAGGWWVFSRVEGGQWLYEVYTRESAQRGGTLGHSGLDFVLLALPVAGHLVTLFAVISLPGVIRQARSWPYLAFLVLYGGLHSWWIFGVERYFIPLAPILIVLAASGIFQMAERLTRGKEGISGGRRRWVVPLLGLASGLTHFAGFAPAAIHSEAVRDRGYVEAVEWVRSDPGDFSVLAYDVFLVGYHDGRHPVIPSGIFTGTQLLDNLASLYINQGLRYVIWSDLYPDDRSKQDVVNWSEPITGPVERNGATYMVSVELKRDRSFTWTYTYPRRRRLLPWARFRSMERHAVVYRVVARPGHP